MGQTYKYPANWTLGTPYELVMDYRGINHDQTNVASRFASKLDMIGIQYEGAFARDYDVYLLHCDPETGSTEGYDWEQVAAFSGLTPMGVGQVETQRIYPADEDGTPLLGRAMVWTKTVPNTRPVRSRPGPMSPQSNCTEDHRHSVGHQDDGVCPLR